MRKGDYQKVTSPNVMKKTVLGADGLPVASFSKRLHKVIPAGCHTYSRGDSQFPSNAPQVLGYGSGAYVYGSDARQYLDYGMGLRSVGIGYAETEIVNAALDGMLAGNCLTRPSMIELEAAEFACDLLGFDMVKFTKNGSTATTAAVKLARAATGRDVVAYPRCQPFFSYDDWFIYKSSRGTGARNAHGIKFTTIDNLPKIHDGYGGIAAIILEPKDFDLKAIRTFCDEYGIILIFDEMITGFRYHGWSKAAHDGVKPDISCFGKAMANGFSVACLGGKREIMEIGARPDMFLASTTHGAEMSGLAAFMATAKFYERENVSKHLRDYMAELEPLLPACVGGSQVPMVEKTLFCQEMIKRGVMMPYVSLSFCHGDKEMQLTKDAIQQSLEAIAQGAVLEGEKIRPVFS